MLQNAIGRTCSGRRPTLPDLVAGHRSQSCSNTLKTRKHRFDDAILPRPERRGLLRRSVKITWEALQMLELAKSEAERDRVPIDERYFMVAMMDQHPYGEPTIEELRQITGRE